LPEDEARFAGGTQRIQPSLRYTDDALRHFFATASTMPWYANTLFVITADHTADLERDGQHSTEAIDHWVPLLYFMPTAIAPATIDRVTQHIDIMPTVLDLIAYQDPFFSFGSSALRDERIPIALVYNNGMYMGIDSNGVAPFDGKDVSPPSPNMTDNLAPTPLKVATMKAGIQQFSGSLLRGKLVAEPTAR
jgi:phosphoglycerol transferase MdoB-like AlkP superfamily enzyme